MSSRARRKPFLKTPQVSRPWLFEPSRWLLFAALAMAFLAHIAALSVPFLLDDQAQIVMNPHIRAWHFVPGYFTSDVWSQMGCGSNYYRPIFLLWLRLNYCLFAVDPRGWHTAALALHVLATGLIFLLARRVCKDGTAAGCAALIFAVHPVTVESVTWISGAAGRWRACYFSAACCAICAAVTSGLALANPRLQETHSGGWPPGSYSPSPSWPKKPPSCCRCSPCSSS